MDQLTQMEFLQVRELLSTEALAVKKCKLYANDTNDEQLRNLFWESAQVHERNLASLLNEMRNHQGKEVRRVPDPEPVEPEQPGRANH